MRSLEIVILLRTMPGIGSSNSSLNLYIKISISINIYVVFFWNTQLKWKTESLIRDPKFYSFNHPYPLTCEGLNMCSILEFMTMYTIETWHFRIECVRTHNKSVIFLAWQLTVSPVKITELPYCTMKYTDSSITGVFFLEKHSFFKKW